MKATLSASILIESQVAVSAAAAAVNLGRPVTEKKKMDSIILCRVAVS